MSAAISAKLAALEERLVKLEGDRCACPTCAGRDRDREDAITDGRRNALRELLRDPPDFVSAIERADPADRHAVLSTLSPDALIRILEGIGADDGHPWVDLLGRPQREAVALHFVDLDAPIFDLQILQAARDFGRRGGGETIAADVAERLRLVGLGELVRAGRDKYDHAGNAYFTPIPFSPNERRILRRSAVDALLEVDLELAGFVAAGRVTRRALTPIERRAWIRDAWEADDEHRLPRRAFPRRARRAP